MATNILRESAPIIRNLTAPTGGTAAGGVIVRVSGTSGQIGVAINDIAAAAAGPCYLAGVDVTLAAITNGAFTDGQLLYWDANAGKLTTTATGNTRAGRASGAKGSSTATAAVTLGLY